MSGRKRSKAAEAPAAAEEPSTSEQQLSNVVFIGHLPHGFYEKELLGFFSQFGKLTRVRMSRNKKTGKSKHYAFLEFLHRDVATIAAEAMNGYFLFKQALSVRVLKQDEVHPLLFRGANRKFKNIPWKKIEMERHDKERTPEEHAQRIARLIAKDKARAAKIAQAGIDYTYDGLEAQLPPKPKKTKFT